MGRIRIGVSGWNYDSWRGPFYPPGMRRKEELHWTASRLDTIEVNGTFYSLKRPEHFRAWSDAAPRDFVYAIKGSRFITHNKKLREVETPLANFFASGVLLLGKTLGPFLWQLPASLHCDMRRLATFLRLLPRDMHDAARLARHHDARVSGRTVLKPAGTHRLRHVLEVRHESYFVPEVVRLLRHHGVALAFSDGDGIPYTEEITAGFVYVRLHGPRSIYASRYSESELRAWGSKLRSWLAGREPAHSRRITQRRPPRRRSRDVYVYFDNDQNGNAPLNALELRRMVPSSSN